MTPVLCDIQTVPGSVSRNTYSGLEVPNFCSTSRQPKLLMCRLRYVYSCIYKVVVRKI
ncbi:hypothetical protein A4A49_53154 [Nicotiana attenuata]|uniref:Uncharacterized protein n=1 Tax=Nicotiana attenuata TaxID=49451 RepID=A0A1J6IRJ0_NICAT|nr:hypothetical protein A4A49_53154 [Nicotiana attenuata]